VQQSNLYIIVFSAIMTIIIGGLLSGVSQVLKEPQRKSVELDTKKQILMAVIPADEISKLSGEEVLKLYEERITSLVTNSNGDILETNEKGESLIAENVNIEKNYKQSADNRQLPVFIFHEAGNPNNVEAYILPLFGAGLWDAIWGYLALETDLETIKGVVLAHRGETPGLGARITEAEVQARFRGKKIYDEAGELVSVSMLKAENNPESALGPHRVDGMSGATITAVGVNNMMKAYLSLYENYLKSVSNRAAEPEAIMDEQLEVIEEETISEDE
jgi:Na+-transporting NADH:ubiquinone oxidoreductase subunit C